MKTKEIIAAEIVTLRTMKPTVRKASMFGDNHHNAIDAQIDVLENLLDMDQVEEQYGDQGDGEDFVEKNVYEAAVKAHDWLHDLSDAPAPNEDWKSLVI